MILVSTHPPITYIIPSAFSYIFISALTSFEEESAFLEQFIGDADGGRITDVSAIKAAYDEKIGHETGHGQIYYVLHRHGWEKKMPRSKHPKSADPEAVEASKKLTLESQN